MATVQGSTSRSLFVLLAVAVLATAWSAVHPADYATWFFELFIGAGGIAILCVFRRQLPFTGLVYLVAAAHYVILAIGAKYTYAEVPLFDALSEHMGWSRNYFDRVGHFAQGVTPALVVRELLLRQTPLPPGRWTTFLSICVALAFSAAYELLEWFWILAFYRDKGPEWLGMQGDPWDTQGDMFAALCGACVAMLCGTRLQDRQLNKSLDKSRPIDAESVERFH